MRSRLGKRSGLAPSASKYAKAFFLKFEGRLWEGGPTWNINLANMRGTSDRSKTKESSEPDPLARVLLRDERHHIIRRP